MNGQEQWPLRTDEVFTRMADWRPIRATLREIEEARDEHLAALRARILKDLAPAAVNARSFQPGASLRTALTSWCAG